MKKTLFLIFLALTLQIYPGNITDYTINTGLLKLKEHNTTYVGLRSMFIEGVLYRASVDPSSLRTFIISDADSQFMPMGIDNICREIPHTSYAKLLILYKSLIDNNTNFSGLTRIAPSFGKSFLSADMCPSKSEFDLDFFKVAAGAEHGFPIILFVSGEWINFHKESFDYLKELGDDGIINILWGNHTYKHLYKKDVPVNANFLKLPDIDPISDITDNEILFLYKGLGFPVFFRFPGLIADKKLATAVYELGLIPLASDSWLAKGEGYRDGSILLIHANGNEKAGIKKAIELIKSGYIPGNILKEIGKSSK